MKKIISYSFTSLLFLTLYITARASNCESRIFQEEKINLYLCQNYSGFSETIVLLFKARTKVLNDFIEEKIEKGKLENKKFEIQIYDSMLSSPQMELTQGKNGYFVTMSGYPSLIDLMAVVNYFSNSNRKPFIANFFIEVVERKDHGTYDTRSERYYARLDDFYRNNAMDFTFSYHPFTVWEKDGVSLVYSVDSLTYLINNVLVPVRPFHRLPVKIQDRYLFFQNYNIFVFQDMKLINTFETEHWLSSSVGINVFSKWVNIYRNEEAEDWIYSYSYDRNKFYRNNQ